MRFTTSDVKKSRTTKPLQVHPDHRTESSANELLVKTEVKLHNLKPVFAPIPSVRELNLPIANANEWARTDFPMEIYRPGQ